MDLFNVLNRLTSGSGVSGDEYAFDAAGELLSRYCSVRRSALGSFIGTFGSGKKHFLLDAHIDRIGLIVTGVDKTGFLRVDSCGGCDARVISAAEVTVWADCARRPLKGVVTSVPPHLTKPEDGDKAPSFDSVFVDVGLTADEAEKYIKPGDRITIDSKFSRLCGDRVTSPALDNRAGATVLLRVLDILSENKPACEVDVLFSVQEETTTAGGKTGAFDNPPDEAIVVDVSFAEAPGIDKSKCGKLAGGPMICISPCLQRDMSQKLIEIAEKNGIKYQIEVCSETTGTNADAIAVTGSGVRTALVSVPIRNMHTQGEIADINDIEAAAKLIAAYISESEA